MKYFCFSLIVWGLLILSASAAERSWDGGGGADNNWGTATNWSSDAAILANDLLSFQNSIGTGTTTVNNNLTAGISYGLLYFMNSAANRAWVLNGNSITLGGDVINSIAATQTINLGLIMSGNRVFYTNSGNVVIGGAGGVISETGGARTLTKDGSFTLTLQNANTYTGGTLVRAGTLQLDFSGTNSPAANIASTAGLTLGGTGTYTSGATLSLQGKTGASNSQTFSSTTLNAGNHAVVLAQNGATSLSLTMGTITRNLGAVLDFTLPASGTVTTSAGTANTVLKDASGVTYATVGGNDWAARGAAGNNVVGLSSIVGGYTATTSSTLAGNADGSTSGLNTSLGATTTNDSVRFSAAEARTYDLNNKSLTTGGILVSSSANVAAGSGWHTISGGTLRAPTGRDLVVIQNSSTELVINANIVSAGMTKSGNGTLVLGGTNTIAGALVSNSGTLRAGSSGALTGVTTLTLGNTAVGNTANLDLASYSATVGALTIKSRSATAGTVTSTVNIAAGQTLTVNGDLRVGVDSGGNDVLTSATFTGGGNLTVNAPTATIQVGNNSLNTQSAASGSSATLNLSGLKNFTANVATFRIGDATGGVGTGSSTVTLAANNDITATNLSLGTGRGGNETLVLGTGTNVLKVDTFNIGFLDGRSNGIVQFSNGLGSLTLGGKLTGTRTNLEVGFGTTGTGGAPAGSFDVRNHEANLTLNTLTVGGRTTGAGGVAGTFQFNRGTLDVTTISMARKDVGTTSTGSFTGVVNLGGGTTVVGTGGIAVSTNASATGNASGILSISGGTVTVGTSGTASITLTSASLAGGTSTGVLNLSGGILSVTGDIIDAGGLGTTTSTFTLSGGTLNLNGNDLGTSAAAIDTINLQAGTLQNIGTINGTGGLTKSTAGTLVVSGINTYTGATIINGGVLSVGSIGNGAAAGTLGNSANSSDNLVFDGGTLRHTGAAETSDRLFSLGAGNGTLEANGSGAVNLSNTGAVGFVGASGGRTLTLAGTHSGTNILAASLGNNGAAVNLVKSGPSTWRLTGTHTYTGSTTVNGGILEIDFGASIAGTSKLNSTSTLILGGGTLRVLGTNQSGESTSQALASMAVSRGASTVEVTANAGLSASLSLGVITRSAGATLNFVLPSAGSISTATVNANFAGGQQSILGGYATVGNNTWAVSSSGVIGGLSTYTASFTAGADVDAPSGTSAPGLMTINSLRFNQAGGATVNTAGNLTIATGGILMTSAVTSAVSINNNNLTSANGQDLVVHQHSTSANLTIASAITGSIGFSKSGAGTVILSGTNTFTGSVYVNQGKLTLASVVALGATPGATDSDKVVLNGGTLAVSAAVDLSAVYGFQVGGNGGTLRHEGARFYIRGIIADVAGQSGTLTISGNSSGDVVLEGANTYTGGTILSAGSTTLVTNSAAFGTGTVTFAGGSLRTGGSVVTLANAINFAANTIIPVNGTQPLTFSGNVTLTGGNRMLTTNSAADTTISGIIGEDGGSYSFTKAGGGRLVLSGINTYSGGTFLNGGTLNINSDANFGAVPATATTTITFTGSTTLQTLYATSVELSATRSILINTSVTASFHAHGGVGSFLVVNGQISGAGNLGVSNSDGGILVLNGNNTYSGTTFIAGADATSAYLRVGHASALGSTSGVTIGTGVVTEKSRLEFALSGSNTIDRNFTVNSRNTAAASFLNLSGSNSLTGTFTSAGAGDGHTFQSDGGSLNLTFSTVTNTRNVALQGSGDGSLNVSMYSSGSTATLSKSGAGTWTVTSAQTTSGAVSITGGTFLANNVAGSATGSGLVSVTGGTLGGTGIVQGNTTISSAFGLRQGEVNSVGRLSFGGDLTLAGNATAVTRLELQLGVAGASNVNDASGITAAMAEFGTLGDATTGYYSTVLATYEAESGSHDSLSIAGSLKLDANGRITLTSLGYSPQYGDVFDLLDWVGALNTDADASGGAGFSALDDLELPTLSAGLAWDRSLFESNGILVVVVPEPGRMLLLLAGLLTAFWRRKR